MHRALPFGTWVAVDNLNNGRTAEVRINDRGPFKSGRILDLSYAAARVLGATDAGEIPVRLRVVAIPTLRSVSREPTFTVQVGAFVAEDHAVALRRELTDAGAEATVERAEVGDRAFYRVRVGHFATRAEARERARHLATQGHAVLVTEE